MVRDSLVDIRRRHAKPEAKTFGAKLARAAAISGQVGKIGSSVCLSKRSGLRVGVLMNGGGDGFLTV